MPGPKPSVRPRPGGGFSPGMGGLNEHLDESAVQAAMQQKALGQQQASAKPPAGKKKQAGPALKIKDELIKKPLKEVGEELKSFVDINTWLGIEDPEDSPEEKMKKKQIHSRWQKLEQEQQQEAKKMADIEMQKKKQAEEEEQARKEQEKQQEAQPIQMPTSPKKGPIGLAGSKKQKATQQLQQSRQGLGKVSGKN